MSHPFPAYAAAPIWQGAFWISYVAWLGTEAWILSRDRRAARGDAGDRGSRRLLVVCFGVGLTSAFYAGQRIAWGRIGLAPHVLEPIALALMWVGVAFRLWAVSTLGRFFRTSVMVLEDHQLIDVGPYRRLRNPSYTGLATTLLGVGLAIGSWPGLAVLMAAVLAGLARRIKVEDAALRARFGAAYAAYAKKRWALIPLVW